MIRYVRNAICTAAMLLAACAGPSRVEVPPLLEPNPNETLTLVALARGVQIYECRVKAGATDPEWVFVAPEAELFGARGPAIGSHGAGPHWLATDGSRTVGAVKTRANAPVAGAIPWLLLTAKSTGPEGLFSKVTSIQRVNTVGGVAPAGGCDRSTVGTSVRVPYTADYRFFSLR